MKNLAKIIKKYSTSNFGSSTISFFYRGEKVEMPVFPTQELKLKLAEINKKTVRELNYLHTQRYIKNVYNAEIEVLPAIRTVTGEQLTMKQYKVKSYFYFGEQVPLVSCYVSQNEGNIKPIYGSVIELLNDLERIA